VVRALAARALALALAPVAAGCATFEDPTIVLDLRVVAMTAEPPEQVVDLDLAAPPAPGALLAQLGPTRVCAHVADPGAVRALRWSMAACLPADDLRCDPALPRLALAEGRLGDPETTGDADGGRACAQIEYGADPAGWIALLERALARDPTSGLAGLDYAIELRVGDPDAPPALDAFAVKQVRLSARFPATKVANHNPRVADLQLTARSARQSAPRRRCPQQVAYQDDFVVRPGDVVTLFPLEPGQGTDEPVREEFTIPTLEGGFETFTETLSYQWLAGAGAFRDSTTGGPPDLFGNETPLGTKWTAPQVAEATDVPIWVIQRDERLGASLVETCIQVRP
jgi:hypothetical protein